jgi:DNA polymerase-3 subunit epsilon
MNLSARNTFGHSRDLPDGTFRFIALDVETACSDAASICQIGLACVGNDNRIQTFSMLVDPCSRFDAFNIRLHGIGPDHVTGAPTFRDAIGTLLPLLSRHHLVQHSTFDKQAVTAACRSCGLEVPALRWSDSVAIARRAWPEFRGNGGHGLAHLKKVLNLNFHHHDAGEDARAAAMVVLHAEDRLVMPFEQLITPVPKLPKDRSAGKVTPTVNAEGSMSGCVAVFTGRFGIARNQATDLAAAVGIEVRAGLTKKTTHLVVGNQTLPALAGDTKTAKHRQAEEMRGAGHFIQIVGETEFLERVRMGLRQEMGGKTEGKYIP